LPLVGGGQSDTDRAFMEAEFAAADLYISTEILDGGEDGVSDLPEATRQYIDLIRKYDDELGEEEAAKRLADKASEVEEWCAQCASMLDRERERIEG
jgi:hypothetical protein